MVSAFRLHIDFVSDVVCPWCVIGFKQLERAAASLRDGLDFTISWHPFELNPQMPAAGQDLREHIREKYGATDEQGERTRQQIMQTASGLGFAIRYSDSSRIYNTFKAHQLLHLAGQRGKQTALELALFETYFTEQQNVDDNAVLIDAAHRAGLGHAEAKAALDDGRYAQSVRSAEQQWASLGISAVPAIVFDRQYLVSGARDVPFFVNLLEQLRERSEG